MWWCLLVASSVKIVKNTNSGILIMMRTLPYNIVASHMECLYALTVLHAEDRAMDTPKIEFSVNKILAEHFFNNPYLDHYNTSICLVKVR